MFSELVSKLRSPWAVLIAALIACSLSLINVLFILDIAHVIATVFVRIMKLLSIPIIFLSILSTITSMENFHSAKRKGGSVLKYTLITTIISATVALFLYEVFSNNFSAETLNIKAKAPEAIAIQSALLDILPQNFVQPFYEHNVIGVLFIAILFGLGILSLDQDKRAPVSKVILGLFEANMQIVRWVVTFIPFAVFSFITIFIDDLKTGFPWQNLLNYMLIVIGANLLQGVIILPTFLKLKRIPPLKTFKAMLPALSIAFFSKSSAAAIPVAIDCAEKNGLKPENARFSLPLCTSINMNACAAFILITVFFVANAHGMHFSMMEKILWILIATIAAVGNAGVPMGCYFLATALLTTMDIPVVLMGVILPFYSLLDMLESGINVWSDSCVTHVVDKELS